MDDITITLPDPAVKAFVDELIAQGTFTSPGDYVLTLIREDRKRRARAQLEALLLEGLEGKPAAMTDRDWEEMRRQYDERNPARTASPTAEAITPVRVAFSKPRRGGSH